MEFPIVIIKEKDSSIYVLDKNNFGLISKGGEAFYNNGDIIDSSGRLYQIKGIENIQSASILKSLKYFQHMYQVKAFTIFIKQLTLIEFKELLIQHITSHSKYWIHRSLIPDLKKEITNKADYKSVIEFLK